MAPNFTQVDPRMLSNLPQWTSSPETSAIKAKHLSLQVTGGSDTMSMVQLVGSRDKRSVTVSR